MEITWRFGNKHHWSHSWAAATFNDSSGEYLIYWMFNLCTIMSKCALWWNFNRRTCGWNTITHTFSFIYLVLFETGTYTAGWYISNLKNTMVNQTSHIRELSVSAVYSSILAMVPLPLWNVQEVMQYTIVVASTSDELDILRVTVVKRSNILC